MNDSEFSVNDRVVVIHSPLMYIPVGTIGVIVSSDAADTYAVRFDGLKGKLHSCAGLCPEANGYYISKIHLKKVLSTKDFSIGDCVKVIEPYLYIPSGATGTVKRIASLGDPKIGIDFNTTSYKELHTLGGYLPNRTGFYLPEENLEIIRHTTPADNSMVTNSECPDEELFKQAEIAYREKERVDNKAAETIYRWVNPPKKYRICTYKEACRIFGRPCSDGSFIVRSGWAPIFTAALGRSLPDRINNILNEYAEFPPTVNFSFEEIGIASNFTWDTRMFIEIDNEADNRDMPDEPIFITKNISSDPVFLTSKYTPRECPELLPSMSTRKAPLETPLKSVKTSLDSMIAKESTEVNLDSLIAKRSKPVSLK